jgi:hypothetical protein
MAAIDSSNCDLSSQLKKIRVFFLFNGDISTGKKKCVFLWVCGEISPRDGEIMEDASREECSPWHKLSFALSFLHELSRQVHQNGELSKTFLNQSNDPSNQRV